MLESLHTRERSYGQEKLARLVAGAKTKLSRAQSTLVDARDTVALVTALLAGEAAAARVIALPSTTTDTQRSAIVSLCNPAAEFSLAADGTLTRSPLLARPAPIDSAPGLVLFSSGTTGTPKAISHTWETIGASGGFVPHRLQGRTWYLAYEPAGYAGAQVIYSAARSGGKLVVPGKTSFARHAELIAAHGVEVISATPTWWRMLVAAWPKTLPAPVLEQATLGGELVDQPTLDLVNRFFQPRHLTHIYASSETGTAIVVSDRLAGFPRKWLGDESRLVQLKVVERTLRVRSPFRMRHYLNAPEPDNTEGWLATGDLIAFDGERCHFTGRSDGRLNIGGAKVMPEEIEDALRQEPDIHDCLVYGKANPVLGTLLVADIVPATGVGDIDTAALKRRLSGRLPTYKVPQHLRLVDEIPINASGKKKRA